MNRKISACTFRMMSKRCLSVGGVLACMLVAGCSVQPVAVVPAHTESRTLEREATKPIEPEVFEPSARTNTAYPSPAAKELISKARRYSGEGDSTSALRYLERAQRISPRAPEVYLAMAEVRLQLGQGNQARQLANKALSLVGDDATLRRVTESFLNEL